MITKNSILFFLMLFIIIFGIVTWTFYLCLFIDMTILCLIMLYKFFVRNNEYKHKVSIAQDFLSHKYGDKMGKYILKESIRRKK